MKKISNKQQLHKEILLLKVDLSSKESQLKESFISVKEELRPEKFILRAVTNLTGLNLSKGDFLRSGLMATISVLLHRFITKQESVLEKKIFSWANTFIEKLQELRKDD